MSANTLELGEDVWGTNSKLKSSEYSVPVPWLLVLRLAIFAAVPLLALAQSPIRIAGVQEPPELTGEPKKFTPPSEALKQFAQALPKDDKNIEEVKIGRDRLTKLLQENPDYSDGFLWRAMFNRCMLNSDNTEDILRDVNAAIATHAKQMLPGAYEHLADHYSFRAKVQFDTGHYQEAINDLEAAMKQNFDYADKIFNSGGTKPDTTSPSICIWTLSDLNVLVQTLPKDYRALLFRGLYFKFFVTFDEKSYEQAFQDFQRSALLNPKSPLPHFYMGALSGTILSPKLAKASDRERTELANQAIVHYTKAIQLDPKFLPAYERRSSKYHGLRQYREAIKDYDKVLEVDPENLAVLADRGLAKAELGQHLAAIFDYNEVIRKAKPDYEYLGSAYEQRAAAYLKVGDNLNAISDLTKAIELGLGRQGFLFSLGQFRALYPEYDGVSDDALCRKLNNFFWPEYEYSVFAKHIAENKGDWAISGLNELYEQRGDAYLRTGAFRNAVSDFNRILKAIPIFATGLERWRLLGSSAGGEQYYLDVKTVEFSRNDPARFWLKTVNKNESYLVQSHEINCKGRRLNVTSRVLYSPNGQVVNSSDTSSGWQRIIPESLGEKLYNGMCSATQ